MRSHLARPLQPRPLIAAVLPLLPALVVVVIAVLLGRALALAGLI
ncbi:hypothetical protein SAMN05518800_3208 [Variovorax sp. YR752]|nr:hypothetical protein [Variovorax sp. YR752]SOD27644.1 hypothetical protein SAMN05518800_3208 [Variovorax sp. YR752]